MKRILSILLCLMMVTALFGQDKEREYRKKILAKANKLYKEYSYVKAVDLYVEAYELGSTSASRKIGDCYRQMNDLTNAEKYYALAVKDRNTRPIYYFYYAQALMSNKKYEAAMHWFMAFKRAEPENTHADKMVKACKDVLTRIEVNSKFKLINLDINSPAQDFAPSFYDKGILFTSSRIESVIRKKDAWTNTGYLDVYYSPLNWRDTIPGVSKIKGNINTFNYHDGPACVNTEEDKIYFTRNNVYGGNINKSKSGDIKLKIFSATKSGEGFKDVKELEFNSNEFSCAHPSINYNEKVIYYSSDRGGGFGGTDIYYSTYNESKKRWNRPVNAGPIVNTEGNERFPFIHENGKLYYSSDGHMGFGGLDIFFAEPHDTIPNEFVSVENLGEPFNSSRDDFSFITDKFEITGYFASNREGGKGNDDVYMFTSATIELDINIAIEDTVRANTWVTIYDADKTIALDRQTIDANGNFYGRLQPSTKYVIVVKRTGSTTIKHEISTPANEIPIHLSFTLKPEGLLEIVPPIKE